MRLLERLEGDFRPQDRRSCNIVGTLSAIGLGISAAASVASSAIGAHAAGKAADAQVAAANHAADLQSQDANKALDFNKLQYGNSLNMLSPYYNMGTASLGKLGFLMGLHPQTGLPAGVVNPNAPSTPGGFQAFSRPNLSDFSGDALMPAGGRGAGAGNPIVGNAFSTMPRFQQLRAAAADPTAQVPQTGTPGAGTSGGFQNPDTLPGSWPGLNGTTAPGATVANGLPGMVPRTDGGGAAPGATGTADPNSGFGSEGSLAQNFGEQWKSPTGVTEVNDPGYQFRINQGLQALQNSAAARGKLLSGDTAKGLNDYAQNSASGEFQNVYNRSLNDYTTRYNAFNNDQNTQFNRFATIAGLGQTSAGQLANVGLGTANNNSNILLTSGQQIGQDYQNAGAARGSGYVGAGNAITGGINGVSNLAMMLAMMKNGGVASTGDPSLCWIAEAVYGVDDPRTHLMRSWMKKVVRFDPVGKFFFNAYLKYGERVAELVKRFRPVRIIFRAIFDRCLVHAQAWADKRESRKPFEDFQGAEYQR